MRRLLLHAQNVLLIYRCRRPTLLKVPIPLLRACNNYSELTIICSQHINHSPRCAYNQFSSSLQLGNLLKEHRKQRARFDIKQANLINYFPEV